MESLCLLDLDHTLIYGSYAPAEEADLLFAYSDYLKVYKRPFAECFVEYLKNNFTDIVVFTTAKEDYAKEICRLLQIHCVELLFRKDCLLRNDRYYKPFRETWGQDYEQISIIDDSPNVWLGTEAFETKINFVIPTEFRGEKEDEVLKKLML